MDRDAIERRDFPVGRRGYEQAAVDEHLRRVADEMESLRTAPRAAAPAMSAGASEQVRAILEAAEAGAAELRAEAGREAGEHVARVQEAAGGMLSRLDQLEGELKTLLDNLRQSSERLNEGMAQLHEQAAWLLPQEPPPADEPSTADEPPATVESSTADEPPAAVEPSAPDDSSPAAEAPATVNGDEAGARLIALNMALSGTPREETARYLAEHYRLADPDGLLDDVYSRAER